MLFSSNSATYKIGVSVVSIFLSTDFGGDVSANDSVRCGEVKGNVRASDSVTCGDISGSVSAERVRCTKAGGEEQESFTFTKKGKSFSFPLR